VKVAGDYAPIQTSLDKLVAEVDKNIENAGLSGVNLLNTAADTDIRMVSGWNGSAGTFNSIDFKTDSIAAEAALLKTGLTAVNTDTKVGTAATAVEAFLTAVKTYAVELGAAKNQVEAQSKFLGVLSESMTNSVSSMVDADMNEASTRLQALQTQQQLGVQSLSIANQNSQMILRLFQ
jgi:flagellin